MVRVFAGAKIINLRLCPAHYTGHDMVNDFEVIHMGGRTYNPVLGRFMQADPFIQQADNLQSFNRYSYVLNNL
ncbi:MAG: hypothetical protein E6Q75_02630 [Rheinheimera sp.]|nr:MAG: hypothetical protein E6Q75_02630 [Rheinheimera sp.]